MNRAPTAPCNVCNKCEILGCGSDKRQTKETCDKLNELLSEKCCGNVKLKAEKTTTLSQFECMEETPPLNQLQSSCDERNVSRDVRNDGSRSPKNMGLGNGRTSTPMELPANLKNCKNPTPSTSSWFGTEFKSKKLDWNANSDTTDNEICITKSSTPNYSLITDAEVESWTEVAGDIYRIYHSDENSHLWAKFILEFSYEDVHRAIFDLVEYKCIKLGANRLPNEAGTFITPFLHQMVNAFLMGGARPILYDELVAVPFDIYLVIIIFISYIH